MKPPAAKTELNDGHGGAESAHTIGIAEGSGVANGTPPPWYRRPGILIAAAALITELGIVGSGLGEPGTAPGGTTGTSTPWSVSFSLVTTGWWDPPPEPPLAAPPPPPPPPEAPKRVAPPPPAPVWKPPPVIVPPPAPPPPPPELVLRYEPPTAAFVSITNNANKPAVGCVLRTVPTAGSAAMARFNVPDRNFTVTGSEETRIPAFGSIGPATGSTFHDTVTCDNGLSTNMDRTW
jgi:hypothetical protein